MLYQVLKGAFDQPFIDMVETIVADIPAQKGATVEEDDYSTRDCDLHWIDYGTKGFDLIHPHIKEALKQIGEVDPGTWEYENIQYTAYGQKGFHDWHIDTFRRSYNRYDLPLGKRFVGKSRKLSVSILLNGRDEFTGGNFEISMFPNGTNTVGTPLDDFSKAGDMAIFDSKLCHRVAPVETGLRKSLVSWICA
ncbi:MAG: 2OG-Fe(II) oxygenase [Rhodospirillales bacterium]|jgi:PKHD-type hydroxylase|nr:2OG-Fe(II) oxygenase [Rhodospirillales bacterium]MBT4006261.1 2OG-Fe(II) oxygenase [Rhodospirillales bacterium]MBT5075649.1 2OG-Fe(II) oxygenase [Rhodospirillales bacterium]MBT5112365.1 2OG-Fe(II) oxygenase [Rhodospirillales bacterium]MBT5672066.1 2OG-Fe(II) oxygenase [Rhodospirillales bacterium]